MDFVTIKVTCGADLIDVLMAELFEVGFDSFQELDEGFEGSCEQSEFDKESVDSLFTHYSGATYALKEEEKVNWNEEWEKNYDPIIIEDKCIVRAAFHEPRPEFAYEIIVTPKMSFGTGHHATTYQILDYQMTIAHQGKRVLDVGTGTGLMAIMAQKRGASFLAATDIDEWCIENSEENFALNNVLDVELFQGQITLFDQGEFDIVIANINKNVLLEQMAEYSRRLVLGGQLILSGFYESDIDDLLAEAQLHGLKRNTFTTRKNWAMLALDKLSV